MEHDYYIAGWYISVMLAVRDSVVECMTDVNRNAINGVVTKLHEPPYPNKIKEI